MTPPFLTAPSLDMKRVAHGFFGRAGGVSNGVYASLNTGVGSDDAPAAVSENRRRAAAAVGVSADRLVTLYQIHSPTVVAIATPFDGPPPQADALVTATPGLALGVLTADCMPFLFADPVAGVIGAAHAGWRGALGGVIEATISAMADLGAYPAHIRAAVGPCLRAENFEVGLDLVEAFTTKHPESRRFFDNAENSGKRLFDLVAFGQWRLAEAGVDAASIVGPCTLAAADAYFSYRASRRAGDADYGRNLSTIALAD